MFVKLLILLAATFVAFFFGAYVGVSAGRNASLDSVCAVSNTPGDDVMKRFSTLTSKIFEHDAVITSNTVDYFEHLSMGMNDDEGAEEKDGRDDDEGNLRSEKDVIVYQPSGQHLLVDMKHVDAYFLNSEDRLVDAMTDLVEEADVTLLSYHCHSLIPLGVSCIGVLLESHISIHTWPHEGALIMDLFTCSSTPLIPILPTIEKLFAISSLELGEDAPEPKMLWSHKLRGFRQGFDPDYDPYEDPLDQEMGIDIARRLDFDTKELLVSDETDFQHVDIWQTIDPRLNSLASYESSLSNDGSYESKHPEFFRPDKILFLDGTLQSTLYGEILYHEALVHPPMFAHPNPKRVAIIGGGEGATLREVLKHKTVDEVVMVEIDGELVEMCKEYIPEWSDCSESSGSDAASCFDDSRSNVIYDDAFKWFIDHFGEGNGKEQTFDVIIMDALDPDRFVSLVEALYEDNSYLEALFSSLSKDGVFVVQLGQSDDSESPPQDTGQGKEKAHMMNTLTSVGFESMTIYDEGHAHFDAPWDILIAFKDYKSRSRWYRSPPEVEIDIHQRLHRTKSGQNPLHYFDGSTMKSQQSPPKATETIFCRRQERPWGCDIDGIDTKVNNTSQLETQDRSDDPTSKQIKQQETIQIKPSTWSIVSNLHGQTNNDDSDHDFVHSKFSSIVDAVKEFGHPSTLLGTKHYTVASVSTNTCTNDLHSAKDSGVSDIERKQTVFSPVVERHMQQILAATRCALNKTTKP